MLPRCHHGLNDAFVLNQTTRDELVAEDKKSEELLKPS